MGKLFIPRAIGKGSDSASRSPHETGERLWGIHEPGYEGKPRKFGPSLAAP